MSGNTTATERLLEVSNKLWDAMYESGEVPTYGERAHYYLALKDAMAENAKLRTALIAVLQCNGITKRDKGCDACPMYDKEKEYVWAGDWCGIKRFISELGIEVDG